MTSARFLIGDSLSVLRTLPPQSVHCVITSPPYLRKRSYLPQDHPTKVEEIGQEATPGEFLSALLEVTNELHRVLREDGTMFINLGDSASGSGGAGGDYADGGLREGQPRYVGTAEARPSYRETPDKSRRGAGGWGKRIATGGSGWPRPKSVCWVPQLFGASLAYGRNLLTGEPCEQWVTRPPITWCKPNPSVGEVTDKFREATELIVFAVKSSEPRGYYFDLDAVREPTDEANNRATNRGDDPKGLEAERNGVVRRRFTARSANPKGRPPYDWWVVPSDQYPGTHYAVMPSELLIRPLIAGCPPSGVVLDPFAGSGTTLMTALGHGRDSIGIDLDERNADLARERVGMWLEVEHRRVPVPREEPA